MKEPIFPGELILEQLSLKDGAAEKLSAVEKIVRSCSSEFSKERLLSELNSLRFAVTSEDDEDAILEVMDFVHGFCIRSKCIATGRE